jgi:hypothetical protein
LHEKKEKLKGSYNLDLEKDFENKNGEDNLRTSTELYEIKNLLKDIIYLEKEEKEKYERYLETIRKSQKKIHENSINVRTFESLAETDEERIKK